jgi:hypothetical protein
MRIIFSLILIWLLNVFFCGGGTTTPNICLQIKNTWWPTRLTLNARTSLSRLDHLCMQYSDNATLCANRPVGQRCMMAGANTQSCLSNPCVDLNDGSCTVQATGGQCLWHNSTKKSGCYRNPCNLAGLTNNHTACLSNSVPGLYTCTWCPSLMGMGCQLATFGNRSASTTKASCAAIPNRNNRTIIALTTTTKAACQCDASSPICALKWYRHPNLYKTLKP